MGKWINADLYLVNDFRLVCWEDDFMPFDFCFLFRKEKKDWVAVGYIDVNEDYLLRRIAYLKWHLNLSKIRLDDYCDIKGGVIAWDRDVPKAKEVLMRLATVLRANRDTLVDVIRFNEWSYDMIRATSGRVSAEGRALVTGGVAYDVLYAPEKIVSLASLLMARATDRGNLRITYSEAGTKYDISYVFVADDIESVSVKDRMVHIHFKGARTDWKLTFPASWFRVKYCDFAIEEWGGVILLLSELARKFFRRQGVAIIDNVTLNACYER